MRLRTSEDPVEYNRAAHDEATEATWLDVVERFPDMRTWVAHNKTVPLSVLEVLRHDADESVQFTVRMKRSWARAHPEDTLRPNGVENTRKATRRR